MFVEGLVGEFERPGIRVVGLVGPLNGNLPRVGGVLGDGELEGRNHQRCNKGEKAKLGEHLASRYGEDERGWGFVKREGRKQER